jgi:hypothetical protein
MCIHAGEQTGSISGHGTAGMGKVTFCRGGSLSPWSRAQWKGLAPSYRGFLFNCSVVATSCSELVITDVTCWQFAVVFKVS